MSRWYRAYEGTVTDPKLAEAAMVAGCSRSVAVAAWHLTLENASTLNDGGRVDIPTRRIAAALCEPLATIDALVEAFGATGILRDSHVTAWNRRQYVSDNSTERSRKHRAKTAETLPLPDDATLQQRPCNGPETETETETDIPKANASGAVVPLSASQVTKAIFDSGIALIAVTGRPDREARSIIGRWRKQYHDSQVLSAIANCERAEDISEPVEWITKALQAGNGERYGRTNTNRQTAPDGRAMGRTEAAVRTVTARMAGPGNPGGGGGGIIAMPDPMRPDRDVIGGPDRVAYGGSG